MKIRRAPLSVLLLALLVHADPVRAGDVELAPFFGLQFGGSLVTPSGQSVSIQPGIQFGATLDIPFGSEWSFEALYARQQTELASAPRVNLAVERYLVGARQEYDVGKARFLGVALLGATRVVPEGYGSDARFTIALGLGLRRPLSQHLGVRADVRGYYAIQSSGGGTACVNANCLFVFGSSGVWQGDVTGALSWTF